jgi:hypothetical protein
MVAQCAAVSILVGAGRLLLDRAADDVRSTWSRDTALNGYARSRNPILDDAWNSYPWASAIRSIR